MQEDMEAILRQEAKKWKQITKQSRRLQRREFKPSINLEANPFCVEKQKRDLRELKRHKLKKNKDDLPEFRTKLNSIDHIIAANSKKKNARSKQQVVHSDTADRKVYQPKSTIPSFGHRPRSASRHLDVLSMAVVRHNDSSTKPLQHGANSNSVGYISSNELRDLLNPHVDTSSKKKEFSFNRNKSSPKSQSYPSRDAASKSNSSVHMIDQLDPNYTIIDDDFELQRVDVNGLNKKSAFSKLNCNTSVSSPQPRKHLPVEEDDYHWLDRKPVVLEHNRSRNPEQKYTKMEMNWNNTLYDPTKRRYISKQSQVNAVLHERSEPKGSNRKGIKQQMRHHARIAAGTLEHPFCLERQLRDKQNMNSSKGYGEVVSLNQARRIYSRNMVLHSTTPRLQAKQRLETQKIIDLVRKQDEEASY